MNNRVRTAGLKRLTMASATHNSLLATCNSREIEAIENGTAPTITTMRTMRTMTLTNEAIDHRMALLSTCLTMTTTRTTTTNEAIDHRTSLLSTNHSVLTTSVTTPTLYTTLTLAMMVFFCLLSLPFYGQDCATGYCPDIVTVHHYAGSISPVTVTISYPVVETTLADAAQATASCWIAQNLGATKQAASATDKTDAPAGWYWQFNRKQGYAVNTNGTPTVATDDTFTPNTPWITSIDENIDWLPENDPCTILLGTGWRIPTNTEWTNVDTNGAWANYTDAYNSVLKLHAGGYESNGGAALGRRGTYGIYWCSDNYTNNTGNAMVVFSSNSIWGNYYKVDGLSLRCLRAL